MRFACGLLLAALLVPSTARAASLDDLAFLVGHWKGEAFGGTIEEIWIRPRGDVMHGVFRAVADGAMSFSEFLQVTLENGVVVMRFAHFRPDYSTWEGDGPPLELRLARVTPTSAVFEATSTNSPARIEYVLEGPDTLAVTVQGIDTPLRFERVE